MIAVIDACSILNLTKTFFDTRFIDNLSYLFEDIYIVRKVYKELLDNLHENINSEQIGDFKEFFHSTNIANWQFHDTIHDDCYLYLNKLTHSKHKIDDNGEYHSSALCLYLSKWHDIDPDPIIGKYMRKIVFITDDDNAKDDFQSFFEFNQIGQVLSSLDIILMQYLSGKLEVSRKDFIDYTDALKNLYSYERKHLFTLLKDAMHNNRNAKVSSILTEIHTLSNKNEFLKARDLCSGLKKVTNKKGIINTLDELNSKPTRMLDKIENYKKAVLEDKIWKLEI